MPGMIALIVTLVAADVIETPPVILHERPASPTCIGRPASAPDDLPYLWKPAAVIDGNSGAVPAIYPVAAQPDGGAEEVDLP